MKDDHFTIGFNFVGLKQEKFSDLIKFGKLMPVVLYKDLEMTSAKLYVLKFSRASAKTMPT